MVEGALAALRSEKQVKGPGLAVYLNIGEATPKSPAENLPPLPPRFRRAEGPAALLASVLATTNVAVVDLEGDGDLDLLVLPDLAPLDAILNDRLLRFHHFAFPTNLVPPARW